MDFGALVLVALRVMKDLLYQRWRIRVTAEEIRGSITREYGFPQNALRITIANRGNTTVEIRDVRLMFSRKFGVPLRDAPPTFTHLSLPAKVEPGTAESWHFPAETIAGLLQSLSTRYSMEKDDAKLRSRVVTSTGSAYRGRSYRFSMDVDARG